MKVNWLIAAAMSIATMVGWTANADEYRSLYRVADDEPGAAAPSSPSDAPADPVAEPEAEPQGEAEKAGYYTPQKRTFSQKNSHSQKGKTDCGCAVDGKSDGGKGGGKSCSDCELVPFELFPETCNGLKIGGHVQMGYHTQGSNGLGQDILGQGFNNYPNTVQLHQAWIYAEKVADTEGCGWDWGFRADYVYGSDGPNTQAFGNTPGRWDFGMTDPTGVYGHAFPQLYGEVAYNDLSIKVGHFYTLAGYEVVNATGNFFYSHAHTMILAEPFTHTGALATYSLGDNTTLYGGWTQGWDTGFDDTAGGSTFLGGASYSINDNMTLTYITTMGDFGFVGASDQNAYSHHIVFDWQITDKLNYVILSDYVDNQTLVDAQAATIAATLGTTAGPTNGKNASFVQYLLYDLNDCWAFGGRFEWFRLGGLDIHEVTLGANYKPHTNVVIRPEVRVDYTPFSGPPAFLQDSTTFGIDAILTF